MEGVADELGVNVAVQGRAHHAGLALVQSGHGVKQMGDPGSAQADGIHGLVKGGAGVADGYGNIAFRFQAADAVQPAGHFRGQGDHPHNVLIGQHFVWVRGQDEFFILGSLLFRVDEGPFQVHTQDFRAAEARLPAFRGQNADGFADACQGGEGHGEGGGQEGGDAVFYQPFRHVPHVLRPVIRHVHPAVAVGMGVDKARGNVMAFGVQDFIRLPQGRFI